MEFTVCIPEHDPHLQCFRDVAEGVLWALGELGHTAHDSPRPVAGSRPIYFGLPLGRIEPDAVLYNGEQVSPQSIWTARRLDQTYRNHIVWDYSPANAARYEQYGLPRPSVVRPGYCPLLEWHSPEIKKTHDVVFFGSNNERRERALQQIEQLGLTLLRVPFGTYGAERDELLSRAKLCLNIHFYERAIFEAVRCSYLAMGGLPVLSEISVDNEGAAYGMTGITYEQLGAYAAALIANPPGVGSPSQLEELRATQAAAIKKVSLLEDVAAALEALNHKTVTYASPVVSGIKFPHLTLSMIVKDEAAVIERCLASVKPYLK